MMKDITLKEVKTQLALGSIQGYKDIAALVKCTTNTKLVYWASKHVSADVRRAAVKHKLCPFGMLIKICFFDRSNIVRKEAEKVLKTSRKDQLERLLDLVEEFPQLSFSFHENEKVKWEELDTEIDED